MTRTISIANAKGGVGKSTVTMLLATALAKQKKQKVLILDTDSQGSISNWLASEQKIFDSEPLVTVEALAPNHVQMYLKKFGEDYDFVFIDIPRMTNSLSEATNIQVLYFCDVILIPAIGSRLDVMSTSQFFNIIQDAQSKKEELGFDFQVLGFLNRETNRTDNKAAKAALHEVYKIPMMENALRELKLFTSPSLFECILDTKEGRERFKPFFNEFCEHLKIK